MAPLPGKYRIIIIGAMVLLAALALSTIFGSRGVLHLQRLEQQQAHAEAIAFTLTQENERLRERLLRLEHDDVLLEKLARERLGWIKSGEFVYRVEGLKAGAWMDDTRPPVPSPNPQQ